jgi:hypothetical protein
MLGEPARVEHRFDDAVCDIGRAAETSGRLGFLQTEAYQVSSLARIVTRRPVLQSTTFHTTLTVIILQNATRTPGDSARFTSVELSENATTGPTTASTPSVLALGARLPVGVSDDCPARERRSPTDPT